MFWANGCIIKTNGLNHLSKGNVGAHWLTCIACLDLPQTKGVQSQEHDTSLNVVSVFSSSLLTETI